MLTTRFVTTNVPLGAAPEQLQRAIVRELQNYGEPLRWAIVSVDAGEKTARIEAVVTVNAVRDALSGQLIFEV
jgi:hypothetical protein